MLLPQFTESWEMDDETGESMLPAARIASLNEFPVLYQAQSERIRSLPVLVTQQGDDESFLEAPGRTHVGNVKARVGFMTEALGIRVQRNANIALFLGNPFDMRLWQMLLGWHMARTAAIVTINKRQASLFTHEYECPNHKQLKDQLAPWVAYREVYTWQFMRDVAMRFVNEDFAALESEIPEYDEIESVKLRLITDNEFGRVVITPDGIRGTGSISEPPLTGEVSPDLH